MTQEQWIKKFSDELKKAQNKIIAQISTYF